jgi:predicted metal-dependent peptidase
MQTELDSLKLAARKEAEEQAQKLMSEARTLLVLGQKPEHVFFATLVLKLDYLPCWSIPTAATDGKKILYNPEFIVKCGRDGAKAVNVHEVLHCVLGHQWRRGSRDPFGFNIAADAAINPMIRDAGFKLPDVGPVMPGVGAFASWPEGLSAEEYYNLIPKIKVRLKGMGEGNGDDPGGMGGVMEPGDGDQSDLSHAEADWKCHVAQAEAAARQAAERQKGAVPSWLERMIGEIKKPKVDWRAMLRDFVSRRMRQEYNWSRPNRRYVWQGTYLPSMSGHVIEGIYVAVDTSGSIGADELNAFAAEIEGVCSACSAKVTILYCDCEVQHVQIWEPTDGPLKLEPKGGGGTSHRPVIDWLKKNADEVACLICLTDLYTEFGDDPGWPTLWAVVGNKDAVAPWGSTIHVEV